MRRYAQIVLAATGLLVLIGARAADASPDSGTVADSRFGEASAPWLMLGRSADPVNAYRWTGGLQFEEDDRVVGYRWRKFSFEQGMSRSAPETIDARFARTRISRLSYKPADNLVLQLARGKISGVDHLIADESLRRTALSASYVYEMPGARMESMVAWGRSSRKLRQSTSGFLIESAVRLPGAHTVFGRLEQVGADEAGLDEAVRSEQRLNRLSVGYVREFDSGPGARLQLGGFVSHYRVPDSIGRGQGDTLLYMMVARLRLR